MNLSSKELTRLITYGVSIFLILLLIDIPAYSFLTHLFSGNISIQRKGILLPDSKDFLNFNNLSFLNWKTWILFLLILGSALFAAWLTLKQLQQIQIQIMTKQIKAMHEQNVIEPIKFRIAQKDVKELINQVNALTASRQQVIEDEHSNEVLQRELIGNISHDLRTPLTSIILGLEMMQSEKKPPKSKMQEVVNSAYRQANLMKKMISDLFEYTQTFDKNSNDLNLQKMNITDFLDQLVAQFEIQSKEQMITMESYTNPNNIEIKADPEKMARVMMNLINNSFKYAIGATFIKLMATVKKNKVVIYVQNDGEMISKSDTKKLFDRFYRVDKSRNKEISGTGLGLAIVKGIVLQHHGKIDVKSDKKLTSFIITLPINLEDGK
ncbi:MAG: HAMP domain-containing histidine kinase [Lactobacillaceae bacterium]|jgi:signal transduction histidine kinase|nr:HAMP domain-containing histidine kinase [Lactobacillaceae bacterium]